MMKAQTGQAITGRATQRFWPRMLLFLFAAALPAILMSLVWAWLPEDILALMEAGLRWGVAGAGVAVAFLLARAIWPQQALLERLSFSLVSVAAFFMLASYLQDVNAYPFKLSWSEGNRFYDYSIIFGKYLYQADRPPELLYNEPGRYALWGILFAIPGLPIWVHRLWNALLFTVPLLLAGWILASWAFSQTALPARSISRLHFTLWVFLFLIQGPIYPSLVISALLVLASARWKRLALKAAVVFLAGYYAALSRWTWLPAPGVWAGLMALLWHEYSPAVDQKGAQTLWGWIPAPKQTILEMLGLGIAGLLGGVLAKPGLLTAPQQATGFALQQPLLWYRLLPNPTYAPGILLALSLAAGPLALFLLGLALTRVWRLSWLQMAIAALPTLAFLGMGTVASTKIGGGSNLHNLDMFLITLATLAAQALRALNAKGLSLSRAFSQPALRLVSQGLLALIVFFPAWSALQAGGPVRLPPKETVEHALETIQQEVDLAQADGEVLFMDQRQLLTFGYIQGVRLVHEYEMKYMMDQSMSGDASRFRQFYADLKNQRFKLIVTHPLKIQYQGRSRGFGEENDAWVKWVAEALLCSYRPKVTIKEVSVQLLEPRPGQVENCP